MKRISAVTVISLASTQVQVSAFAPQRQSPKNVHVSTGTELKMGLFDGMKEAFSAPPAMTVGSERETPIDRWMGWNVNSESETQQKVASAPVDFVDSMEEKNYITTKLTKPMGIVFEENDEENGGIFVISLSEDGAAEKDGTVKPGDQLVAVNENKVSGLSFDDALGQIVEATTEHTKLTFFRGTENQLYGPTGASTEWLEEFIASNNVKASS